MIGEIKALAAVRKVIRLAADLESIGEKRSAELIKAQMEQHDQDLLSTLDFMFGTLSVEQQNEFKKLAQNALRVNRFFEEYREQMEQGPSEKKADAIRNLTVARFDPRISTDLRSLYFETARRLDDHHVHALMVLAEHRGLIAHSAFPNMTAEEWELTVDCVTETERQHPELVVYADAIARPGREYRLRPLGERIAAAMMKYDRELAENMERK